MKKVFVSVLVALLLFALAACGDQGYAPADGGASAPAGQPDQSPAGQQDGNNAGRGEIDKANWLDYLTDTYYLPFSETKHSYYADAIPVSVIESETAAAKCSVFIFEGMPLAMQNCLVTDLFDASAELSEGNNLHAKTGDLITDPNDLYFYGNDDPEPTKAWRYAYNSVWYAVSIALSMNGNVTMTVSRESGSSAPAGQEKQPEITPDTGTELTAEQFNQIWTSIFGYWNAAEGRFVVFDAMDSHTTVCADGIWGSGYYEGGTVSGYGSENENELTLTVFYPAVEENEMESGRPERTDTVIVDYSGLEQDGKIRVKIGADDWRQYMFAGQTSEEAYQTYMENTNPD